MYTPGIWKSLALNWRAVFYYFFFSPPSFFRSALRRFLVSCSSVVQVERLEKWLKQFFEFWAAQSLSFGHVKCAGFNASGILLGVSHSTILLSLKDQHSKKIRKQKTIFDFFFYLSSFVSTPSSQ